MPSKYMHSFSLDDLSGVEQFSEKGSITDKLSIWWRAHELGRCIIIWIKSDGWKLIHISSLQE